MTATSSSTARPSPVFCLTWTGCWNAPGARSITGICSGLRWGRAWAADSPLTANCSWGTTRSRRKHTCCAISGSPASDLKHYRNLFGITLGTGLGGGLSFNGELFLGDNSIAAEAHLLRNLREPGITAEEGASIRAVRRVYAEAAGIGVADAPDPAAIFEIGMGRAEGNAPAAREAFRRWGEVAGDVLAQALALVDGLAVVGGGISGAHPLFLAAMVDAVNGQIG